MGKEELEQLRRVLEAEVGDQWETVVDHLRDTNQLEAIAERLSNGAVDQAVTGVEAAATRVAAAIEGGYTDAAVATSEWLDKKIDSSLITYDSTNDRAAEWARMNRAGLVREVTQETRDVISQVVSRGVRAGTNPLQQAKEIRDSIGLTAKQESYVDSYRKALSDGDWSNALSRELRDGRSDKTLRKLLAGDGTERLTQKQIDGMVERYRKNFVAHRAKVIARTESLRATHEGNEEALQQAIDSGDVSQDDLIREWHTAVDARVRDSHGGMQGQTRRFGQQFKDDDGNLLSYPGDPSAPGYTTIMCRCVVSTRILTDEERVKTPKGFDDQGRKVVDGLPSRAEADKADDDGVAYSVKMSDIRDKLIATPLGEMDSEGRKASVRQAWADDKQLPPIRLSMGDDGKLFVADGRHRLMVADEDNMRRVLVRVTAAPEGINEGTVPLFSAPDAVASDDDESGVIGDPFGGFVRDWANR